MSATVKVHLLGRDYLLRSQGAPDRVQEAAALVEEKLSGLTDSVSVDTRDRFILALLNLAGESLQERSDKQALEARIQILQNEKNSLEEQFVQLEKKLVERIEDALDH